MAIADSIWARPITTVNVRYMVQMSKEELDRIIDQDVVEPVGRELYNRILKRTHAIDCNYCLTYPEFGISVKFPGSLDVKATWDQVFVLIHEYMKEIEDEPETT